MNRTIQPPRSNAAIFSLLALLSAGCVPYGHPHTFGVKAAPSGPIILAGGGGEGEITDPSAWSVRLYKHMLDGGDITGDGKIRIALLAARQHTEFLCRYFEKLGATEAFNVNLDSPAAADAASLDERFKHVDAIFIKGGDQGIYYDKWNDRRIEGIIKNVYARGGAVGGTSAGEMSMAQYALAGSKSLQSEHVLADSRTPWLDDESDGGTALHNNFLGFVPNCIIDSHFNQRHRFERLLGALAKAREDNHAPRMTGIGIDEKTGAVLNGSVMTVIGNGTVTIISADEMSASYRDKNRPPMIVALRFEQLVDGCVYDLARRTLVNYPNGEFFLTPIINGGGVMLGSPASRPSK